MGIQGLLPILKDITRRQHVSEFSGKRVAIDGYSWLYKGAYCCSRELCEGEATDRRASSPDELGQSPLLSGVPF